MMSGLPITKRTLFGVPKPALLAQNRPVIEFHEEHQPGSAQTGAHCTLQFSEGPCALVCFRELGHVRPPDGSSSAATTASNGLEDAMLKRSTSTLLTVMFFFLSSK
jgi:hypothetical protein